MRIIFIHSFILLLLLVGCNNNNTKTVNSSLMPDTIIVIDTIAVKDTIYMNESVPDSYVSPQYYSTIYRIERGDNFELIDNNDNYFYYRLVFSSSEEMYQVYLEMYEIVFDGILDLRKRILLSPDMLTQNVSHSEIEFVKWNSPKEVELRLKDKNYFVNLDTIK